MTPEQARQQYNSQGFVFIRGALSGAEVKRVLKAFDRAAKNDSLYDLLHQDEVFVDMVDHPAIFPVVRAVIGEDVHCAMPMEASGKPTPNRAAAGTAIFAT